LAFSSKDNLYVEKFITKNSFIGEFFISKKKDLSNYKFYYKWVDGLYTETLKSN
jgi:hypothetical protein